MASYMNLPVFPERAFVCSFCHKNVNIYRGEDGLLFTGNINTNVRMIPYYFRNHSLCANCYEDDEVLSQILIRRKGYFEERSKKIRTMSVPTSFTYASSGGGDQSTSSTFKECVIDIELNNHRTIRKKKRSKKSKKSSKKNLFLKKFKKQKEKQKEEPTPPTAIESDKLPLETMTTVEYEKLREKQAWEDECTTYFDTLHQPETPFSPIELFSQEDFSYPEEDLIELFGPK